MRTDEHQKAQDGKFRFNVGSETIDIRVSIVPVTQGENVVMRLLSSSNRRFGLADLGLNDNNLEILRKAMKNPHGMILVTGPTGSGKTTTLYAIINILNKRNIHIATIEDPVEYDIESVTQIQVNSKTNLTFAKGLRALVRQDPDIIMVGEIRDEETADIAVNSAMTGHLVLSTLHTNDAATAIPRFLDMGVEPFLIASTVNIVIAQRLVREICPKCRISYQPTHEESLMVEGNPGAKAIFKAKAGKDFSKLRLYKGAGCKICGQTGYSGRIGIFEILEMTEDIKKLVVSRASSDDIMSVAIKKNKMTTMLEDGIEKVLAGETTMEEVLRVTI
jgi:type II secretory ATPase GspE/PulE/Tfp pilus assembly ATPase PilB-like protein